ncbi:hypothetical protein FH972_025513 [Carpinus fangiana]|uniref:Uncharacterized protein n=1 Tax=Carpinus fangiana TaxID=176857 RepID=A0A5N6L1C7_9ROSI|nr:hypothetical protein FH972_025513 [Carpinus fangiana]
MITHDGLMRIFWPADPIRPGASGTLVGWRNSDSDLLVAALLLDAEPRVVDSALRVGTLFRNSPHPVKSILSQCGPSNIQVLGTLNPLQAWSASGAGHITAHTDASASFPKIQLPLGVAGNVQLILYSRPRPDRMQYMSLDPISLALTDKTDALDALVTPFGEEVDAAEKLEKQRRLALVEKLRLHTVHTYPSSQKELVLPTIVSQINCSLEINALLQKNIGAVRRRARRTLSVSERVVESASDLWDYTRVNAESGFRSFIWPIITWIFIFSLMAHRIAAEMILMALSYRARPHYAAIKDMSATAQQIDLRLQQFCYWPIQHLTLRRRKDTWQSISTSQAEYIRFYNSLWLVANDIIMGIAVGSYIIENADAVASLFDTVLWTWSLEGLNRMISWLMVYPAGLKLNNELAVFLGDLFLWVIDYWAGCMAALQPYFPTVIRIIGFASFAGATMPLSMASDLVSFTTLHIHCFYLASARIYSWQLTIIISLFHLFRGKKRNVLRNRIDSCDYELDQLLLGTILFTLLFFLLPTVLVFYLTFAIARMGIISLKAVLDTMLACLNHFPLFALMLRVKDPWRLPGGIRFELQETPSFFAKRVSIPIDGTEHVTGTPRNPTSCITLKSIPLPLPAMFHEYNQLGSRIRKHYISLRVFLLLATGGFVPPLHRKNLYGLQYSMLPAVRVGIGGLWALLTAVDPGGKANSLRAAGMNGAGGVWSVGAGRTAGLNGGAPGVNGHSAKRSGGGGNGAVKQAKHG